MIIRFSYYPPYGSALPGLQYNYADDGDTSRYRFGFNNQEQDSELGDYYAFEYRIHDARLGRFLSVDPLKTIQPFCSHYSYAWNQPIWAIDAKGSIRILVIYETHYSDGRTSESPETCVYDRQTLEEVRGITYTDVHLVIHQYEIGMRVGNIPAYPMNIIYYNDPTKKSFDQTGGKTVIDQIYEENWFGGFAYEMTMKNWPVAKWTQALDGKDALTNEDWNYYERTAKIFEGALDLISYGEGKTLGGVIKEVFKDLGEEKAKEGMDKVWAMIKEKTKIDAKVYMKLAYGMLKLGSKYALKDQDIEKLSQLIKPVLEGTMTYGDFVNDVYKTFSIDIEVDYESKDDAVKSLKVELTKYIIKSTEVEKVSKTDNIYTWKED